MLCCTAWILLINSTKYPIIQLQISQNSKSISYRICNRNVINFVFFNLILKINTYPGASIFSRGFRESVLMHNPIGFSSFRCFANVKHESFFNSNFSPFRGDYLVRSRSFPITRASYSVRPRSIWVLSVSRTEKIPFFFPKNCLTFTKLNKFAIRNPN